MAENLRELARLRKAISRILAQKEVMCLFCHRHRLAPPITIYQDQHLGKKTMLIILLAVILGLIPAFIASSKGRSFVLWWVYGSLLFIVALPHAIFARSANVLTDRQNENAGNKKCPQCAEWVRREAKICKHCNHALAALS